MLGGFFMSINIENMEKPKCAEIFWQMQKQFWLTTMIQSHLEELTGKDGLTQCEMAHSIL